MIKLLFLVPLLMSAASVAHGATITFDFSGTSLPSPTLIVAAGSRWRPAR